jgi:hypothetical protein
VSVPASGDAAALARALAALDVPCDVESRAGLALLTMGADVAARLAGSPGRMAVLALAKEHGFTHVAVELGVGPAGTRAAVLRD